MLLVALLLLPCSVTAQQPDSTNAEPSLETQESLFFVYAGSFSTKAPAQELAARIGGWVLRTDLYTGLAPGFFATVFGPFTSRSEAELALLELRDIHSELQVRSAGAPILPESLGDANLLSAVLGELSVVSASGSSLPCAPPEPHTTILVNFVASSSETNEPPVAGFWVVNRTGEIIPIRGCGE